MNVKRYVHSVVPSIL